MKEALEKLLADLARGPRGQARRAVEAWEAVVPERLRRHASPVAMRGRKLIVAVDSPAWAFELSTRYRMSILKRMQNELGSETIQDIHFRAGGR